MSNSTKLRGNIGVRGKRRLVAKTRWELPFDDSKPYWDAICKDIESKVSMTVRNPLFSNPISNPITAPSSILSTTASSVHQDDPRINKKEKLICNPVAKTFETTSSFTNSPTGTKLLSENVEVAPDLIEFEKDRLDSISSNSFGLTKLSKMTRLVNNFLSNIRPHVVPRSPAKSKKIQLCTNTMENNRNFEAVPMTEKSFNKRSKDKTSRTSSLTNDMALAEESTAESVISKHPISNKKTVIFRDSLEGRIAKEFKPKEEIRPVEKTRRARAPSLSIASAVPSFGKVVISIEDIDSIENEDKYEKSSNSFNEITTRDIYEKIVPAESKDCDEKTTQDFLKVPQVRSPGTASYPIYDESKYEQLKNFNERRFTDEVYESTFLRDTQAFQKKYKFWPKRSIVNVFRAVKTMRRGLTTKARIESETNQFFAAPLEVYSPSARSSISSDDQIDFEESNVTASISDPDDDEIMVEKDYDGNEWRENIEKQSNASSYTSVRERLMRNAVAHLSKASQHDAAGTWIDISNAPEVTFEQADPSSFYTSWATSKNEVMEKRPNKKTFGRHFIGIPRVNRIFPRVKADKCLACMCQSLGDTHQPRPRKELSTLWNDGVNNDSVLTDEKLSPAILNIDFSSTTWRLDHLDRDRYRSSVMAAKAMKKLRMDDHPAKESITDLSNDQVLPEDFDKSKTQQSVTDPSKNTSQIDDPHRSQALARSPTKILVTAQTLITSLISDRTRSISDQDDSDQGFIDSAENEGGVGGGSTMKNLAPCHMPINLKPSLEPLKALKNKKSRSIRSRVASAEKSGDSADDDEDNSDYEENIRRQPLNEVNKKLETITGPRGKTTQKIGGAGENTPSSKDAYIYAEQSVVDSGEMSTHDNDPNENIKCDLTNDLPIISNYEVIEISKKCLANGMTIVDILQVLANEYSNRLTSRYSRKKCFSQLSNARENEKKAINLMTLLAESKSYLNRGKRPNNPPDLLFSSKQPSLCNARQLRRILPLKSYNLVAPILGMAKWYPIQKATSLREIVRKVSRLEPSETSEDEFDLIVHPPSRLERNVSFEKSRKKDHPKFNPYSLFLIKPRRKAVTWRPLTERDLEGYDPEATLKKRAAKITDKICEDFCQWLESLATGTNTTSGIDIEVLKDMFETDFTAEVCRTMQMCIKEMPMVPTAVATARNCLDATELALTRKHLAKDAKAEMNLIEMAGFGTSLPIHRRFKPPRNQVDRKWLQCEHVPKELETMEAVWNGITHLESVQGFAKWLKVHPEVKRPMGLEKVFSSRQTLGPRKSVINDFKDQELDLDQIQSLRVADNAADTF